MKDTNSCISDSMHTFIIIPLLIMLALSNGCVTTPWSSRGKQDYERQYCGGSFIVTKSNTLYNIHVDILRKYGDASVTPITNKDYDEQDSIISNYYQATNIVHYEYITMNDLQIDNNLYRSFSCGDNMSNRCYSVDLWQHDTHISLRHGAGFRFWMMVSGTNSNQVHVSGILSVVSPAVAWLYWGARDIPIRLFLSASLDSHGSPWR